MILKNLLKCGFLFLILCIFVTNCTTKKKIDYKKHPHYPYIIE